MEKFKTVKELNDKAAELKSAGDLSELVKLAEENGLEKEDAEDYMDSDDPEDCLCNATMAAIGRLNMEEQDLHLESQMKDWKDFIVQMLTDYPADHAVKTGTHWPMLYLTRTRSCWTCWPPG